MNADSPVLRRDGHRFLGPDDDDGKPGVRYVQWDETLYFDIEHPSSRVAAVTDGWIQDEAANGDENAAPHAVEPHERHELALYGTAKLRPGHKLGFITESGVTLYSGRIEFEAHSGAPEEGQLLHFASAHNGKGWSKNEPILYVSVTIDADRMQWFQTEMLKRPTAALSVGIKFKPYIRLGHDFDRSRLYIEPDNSLDKNKHCAIFGAALIISSVDDAHVDKMDGEDGDEAVLSPVRPSQTVVAPVLVKYLSWIIGLQIVIAVLILFKR